MISSAVYKTTKITLDQLTNDEIIGCAQVHYLGQSQEGRPWWGKVAVLYTIPTYEGPKKMHPDTLAAFEAILNERLDKIEQASKK